MMKPERRSATAQVQSPEDPLAGAIARALDRRLGGSHEGVRRARTVRIVRRPSVYRSTLPLFEVDAALDDGTRLELVLKRLGGGADARALQARPAFLRRSKGEARVYRHVLSLHSWLGAPRFYGTWSDRRGGAWLLLERVGGVPLWQAVGDEPWVRTAEWLGGFHARFLEAGAAGGGQARLRTVGKAQLDRWLPRAVRIQRPGSDRQGVEALTARVRRLRPSLADRVLAAPTTLMHGEFYPANILVESAPGGRVCPLDWEMAARGPGLLDLGALVTGLDRADQARLVDAYCRGWLAGGGDPGLTGIGLGEGLAACRLQLALQWLGWSRDWTPPPEQARDWLEEAETMLEELQS